MKLGSSRTEPSRSGPGLLSLLPHSDLPHHSISLFLLLTKMKSWIGLLKVFFFPLEKKITIYFLLMQMTKVFKVFFFSQLLCRLVLTDPSILMTVGRSNFEALWTWNTALQIEFSRCYVFINPLLFHSL